MEVLAMKSKLSPSDKEAIDNVFANNKVSAILRYLAECMYEAADSCDGKARETLALQGHVIEDAYFYTEELEIKSDELMGDEEEDEEQESDEEYLMVEDNEDDLLSHVTW
jgi:hypothetical protein